MADGGQRLLDVIDDPNALESFLGGLTADTELLPSAETVDNVVASLARSLGENEYEVDSPNETLFDTLDSSSNHLTDISRSYVPSDFGHVAVQNDAFTNNLDGFTNGSSSNVIRGNHLEQQTHQGGGVVENSGCDQFIGSSSTSTNNIINSTLSSGVISATSSSINSNSITVTANSNLKQISASVSNCDPSKTSNNFVQPGQQQINSIIASSAALNNLNYSTFTTQDLHNQQLKQDHVISVSQNQLNQATSLSTIPVEAQVQQNSGPSNNSTNNLISAVIGSSNSNENGGAVSTLTTSTSAPTSFQQQTGQSKAQILTSTSSGVTLVASSSGGVTNDTIANASSNNVTLSTNTNVVGSVNNLTAATIQQPQHQFLTNTSTHQQLVSGQTVNIPSMTVSAPQLIANSHGGIVAASAAGQNIIQQLQTASAGQSYIAMEQPTTALLGATTFGAANVALVATGGTPTYAVLPTTPQFLTNAIIPQTHAIQTLTKTAGGAFFQTTGAPQLVATSTALQNVSAASTATSTSASPLVTSVSSSTETSSSNSMGQSGQQQTGTQATTSSTTVTDGVVTQLIQQSQQQITNVSGNTGTVAITPSQSFTIGSAAGLGQVVVSQVNSLGSMTAPQQTQLTGTIVVNQYGQPMLLPTASTAQAGLQLILRQQPAQPQVLAIQAQAQAGAATGKPIVRYLSQIPQMAQTQGYGLQQIQTANGPTWVAVRYPQVSQASQFSQISAESIVTPSQTIQSQIATGQSQQIQVQTQQIQQLQQQQAQQLIQQTQQQQQQQAQQIQLQAAQTAQLQVQQQVQVQNQLQTLQSQQQQQINLQTQAQLQNQHQGQLATVQQNQQQVQQQNFQQQTLSHQTLPQTPVSMESQSTSVGMAQQNQYSVNRVNQTPGTVQNVNQSQSQYDSEQQQVSVPDSSSEPPPPKKAKTKSKSSKKKEKVTLDLEQLLKQSGIMDEDLNDDMMSFDFGFGSMEPQTNGLPPSPQVPPAQIPVINTTETPKKTPAKKSKSNAKNKTPAQPPAPSVPQVITAPIITGIQHLSAKKKSPKKKNNQATTPAPPPVPTPPVQLPPPPPIVTTPTSSKSKSSKKKKDSLSTGSSGSVNENQKSEPKTASSKKTAPPKKVSSLETLLDTINAVVAGASSSSPLRKSPTPPLPPPPPTVTTTPTSSRSKPSPSPKNKEKKSKSKKSKTAADSPLPPKPDSFSSAPVSISNSPSVNSPSPLVSSNLHFPQSSPQVSVSNFSVSQPSVSTAGVSLASPMSLSSNFAPMTSMPSISSVTQQTARVTGPNNLTNGNSAPVVSPPTSQPGLTGLTRVVQTIQLTPQNQQLLRNIQSQIQRLLAVPKRNETEQSALQKLVVLQQQVIATGKPVAVPTHLNNLAQSVNVDPINVASPGGTVPSTDFATTSSPSTNVPLISPSVSCEFDVSPSPVSSTVVTTAAMSVLASSNNIILNSSSASLKLVNSNTSAKQLPSTSLSSNASNHYSNSASGGGTANSSNSIVVGSPSVSSTASPDSTSLSFDISTSSSSASSNNYVAISTAHHPFHQHQPQNTTTTSTNTSTSTTGGKLSCGGVGNMVVSSVKTEIGQLVASVSIAPSAEEKHLKDNNNTQGKGAQCVITSTAVPVPVTSTTSSVSFSQHLQHVPPNSSYLSSTFSARPPVDEKKAEEQRLANLKMEEEKRARWKKEEFDMLLQRDQQYVAKPDYVVPFESNKDAVERLMKYHIYKDRNDMNFEEFDTEFGNNAVILLEKFSVMMSKYRNLLLKESMKEVSCAERVMLERMFVGEEKLRLEQDRLLVAQGDALLDMPPPPKHWIPKIKEMVDKEMVEFEPQDPIVSQQVQSAIDSIIGCDADDTNAYMLEEGDKIEYDAFGVPITSSGYGGLGAASSADIDEAVRSILT